MARLSNTEFRGKVIVVSVFRGPDHLSRRRAGFRE